MSGTLTLLRQDGTPEISTIPLLRHPVFAWLGLRPILGQHTVGEDAALRKWAAGRSRLVEIGVGEGASALGLRESMSPKGVLWLIDPFHLSRRRRINAMKRAAHRAVAGCRYGRVVWIEEFSVDAAKNWREQIDFLFIDGDHSETGVRRDWDDWSRFVTVGGVVIFHDARVFPEGWPTSDWGSVRVVEKLFRNVELCNWRVVQELDSLVVVERR